MAKSPITCHILDASAGRPAQGVFVELSSAEDDRVAPLAVGQTDSDGRCTTLLAPGTPLRPGAYKMTFRTASYFEKRGVETFYPFVEITFMYKNPSSHYHIPLLLSPWSYTTYRGS